jgi:hypothetical protein
VCVVKDREERDARDLPQRYVEIGKSLEMPISTLTIHFVSAEYIPDASLDYFLSWLWCSPLLVAMFTLDSFACGISPLNNSLVILTFEKEFQGEVTDSENLF